MFNVLTQDLKNAIKKEYWFRFLFVVILSVIFLQISFLIFLLPSWLTSFYKEKDIVLQEKEPGRMSASQDAVFVSSLIESTNIKLNIIDKSMSYGEIIPEINMILDKKIRGISISQFTFAPKNQATSTASIQGVSDSRESLVYFVKKLQTSGMFSGVDSPVSNFAKNKNINFSINLTIAP